jgi:hypothetical protein
VASRGERRFGVNRCCQLLGSAKNQGANLPWSWLCTMRSRDASDRDDGLEQCESRLNAQSTLILRTLNLRALSAGRGKRKCHPESAQLSVVHLYPAGSDTVYMGDQRVPVARAFTDIAHPESALSGDGK